MLSRKVRDVIATEFARQYVVQRPFNATYCLPQQFHSFLILVTRGIKRDNLKRVANVMIHFRNRVQTLAKKVATFPIPSSRLPKESACNNSGKRIGNCQEIVTRDPFVQQDTIEHDACQRNNRGNHNDNRFRSKRGVFLGTVYHAAYMEHVERI